MPLSPLRLVLPALLFSGAVLSAGACTGDDPVIGAGIGADSGGGDTAAPGDSGGTETSSGSDATTDAQTDALAPGERYACPTAAALPSIPGDRVVFEPRGLIVDATDRLIAWEESKSKRRAVPENAAAGATRVTSCCASFGMSGALKLGHFTALEVAADQPFALHTLVRRTNAGASTAGGGAFVIKKPTEAFPFTGYGLTVAGRDPVNGLEDKPAFQLQYDPRIAAVDGSSFPTGTLINFSGIRSSTALTIQIGANRIDAPNDGLPMTNTAPLYIGGGGDNHFVGEICAFVLEVGDQLDSDTRSKAIGAYRP